jgi:ABC-type sulfate transport system substrate-binding protein
MMVAKGNPKAIATIDDLVRSDVPTSMPNPVNKGIMQFYPGRQIRRRHRVEDGSDEALRQGAPIEGLELPAADSLRDTVSYATGALQNARHRASADDYLAFLATKVAQDTCASFGFGKARPAELALKPIG